MFPSLLAFREPTQPLAPRNREPLAPRNRERMPRPLSRKRRRGVQELANNDNPHCHNLVQLCHSLPCYGPMPQCHLLRHHVQWLPCHHLVCPHSQPCQQNRHREIGSKPPNLLSSSSSSSSSHLLHPLHLRRRGRETKRLPPARLVPIKRYLNHLLQNLHELPRSEGGVQRRSGDDLLL